MTMPTRLLDLSPCCRKSKGQAALEYMVMMATALLIASPIILQAQGSLGDLQEVDQRSRMADVLNSVEEGATLVYTQGEPSRASFSVTVPQGVRDANVSDQHISYTLELEAGNTTFIRLFDFPVQGKLPDQPGRYRVTTRAVEDYVNITYR